MSERPSNPPRRGFGRPREGREFQPAEEEFQPGADSAPEPEDERRAPTRTSRASEASVNPSLNPPHSPPEDWDDDEFGDEEDEPEGRGCGFWLTIALILIAALSAAGYFATSKLLERFSSVQLDSVFPKISLLPSSKSEPIQLGAEARIYYAVRGRALTAEVRRLSRPAEGDERAHLIALEMLQPPKTPLLEPAIPPGTELRGVFVQDGVVLIDLSSAFAKPAHPSPTGERLAVYAIVNGFLLNDSSLKGVRLLVEGQPITTAWGWLDLSRPLTADLSLIQ